MFHAKLLVDEWTIAGQNVQLKAHSDYLNPQKKVMLIFGGGSQIPLFDKPSDLRHCKFRLYRVFWEDIQMNDTSQMAKTISEPPLPLLRRLIAKLKFFPKTHDFFIYFERSSETAINATRLLSQMIANKDGRITSLKTLKDLEHTGDAITHEVIDLARSTFLTPFDRSDIHALAVRLDDILDITYHIGNRLTRYNLTDLPEEVIKLSELLLSSASEVDKAMHQFRDMKNAKEVLAHCTEISRLEKAADDMTNLAIEAIFRGGYDPIQVIKLKEIIEHLERATDKCKNVANIIEGIMLKHG